MEKPSVSIIVPVYNVEQYIEDCIRSVMRQTYDGLIECILVDDCGNDNSVAVVDKVIAEYKGPIKFRFLHHTHNCGLSAARNTGIDNANCDYIYFLDSDDELTENSIDSLVRPLKEEWYDVVVGDLMKVDSQNQELKTLLKLRLKNKTLLRENEILCAYQRKEWTLIACNKLYRTSFLMDYLLHFKEGIIHEDVLWTFQIACLAKSLYAVNNITYIYKRRNESIMNMTAKCKRAETYGVIVEELVKFVESNSIKNEYTHEFIIENFYNALKYYFGMNKMCIIQYNKLCIKTKISSKETLLYNGYHIKRYLRDLHHFFPSVIAPYWIAFIVEPSYFVRGCLKYMLSLLLKIPRKLRHIYQHKVVKEQYPMLTTISKRQWEKEGAIGVVYMLHHVMEKNPLGIPSNENLKVSPAFLEKVINKYRNNGFDFISLDELSNIISSGTYPKRHFVVFTIDDGYLDNYTNAFPLFEKYGVPFTLFLSTDFADKKAIIWWDCIEKLIMSHDEITTSDGIYYPCRTFKQRQQAFVGLRRKIQDLNQSKLEEELNALFCKYDIDWYAPIRQNGLSWDQIKELANHPLCTIGGHTVTHPALNKLCDEDFRKEIKDCVMKIEAKTGKEVRHFAYPYGSSQIIGNREYQLIKDFSFKTAFISYGGCIKESNYVETSHLPRVGLYEKV